MVDGWWLLVVVGGGWWLVVELTPAEGHGSRAVGALLHQRLVELSAGPRVDRRPAVLAVVLKYTHYSTFYMFLGLKKIKLLYLEQIDNVTVFCMRFSLHILSIEDLEDL